VNTISHFPAKGFVVLRSRLAVALVFATCEVPTSHGATIVFSDKEFSTAGGVIEFGIVR
jgi:hypothetical protein